VGAYRTVAGTLGSDTWLRAVARAGAAGATLVVVSAYLPMEGDRDLDTLDDEAFQVTGSTPAENTASQAADEARKTGAGQVTTVAVAGSPVEGLLLGSVPADATRRSEVDVLVVHTT
jgi:nucleotide-binding universal stress UspA family protein